MITYVNSLAYMATMGSGSTQDMDPGRRSKYNMYGRDHLLERDHDSYKSCF